MKMRNGSELSGDDWKALPEDQRPLLIFDYKEDGMREVTEKDVEIFKNASRLVGLLRAEFYARGLDDVFQSARAKAFPASD